jgi:hypothetical protein
MRMKYPDDKTKQKKAQINWGLLLLGLLGAGGYLWEKRKKEKIAQAQAQAYKDRLLPPVKKTIVHTETGSPEARLRAMNVDTSKVSQYQAGEIFKEV